jgi:hypothetical protein
MIRKLLILLLILGIFVVPFLANNIEGMTSTETTNNPPPPSNNPTTPSTNPTTPSTNPTTPSTNPTQPYNPSYPNYPTHNTNTNTTYSNYPYPTQNDEPHNEPTTQQNNSPCFNYYNSLPKGVPRNQILPGQEDLYILKSQVVPPVCPACNPVVIYKNKPCEACPACARCPEPSFECKKVPNYNAINNEFLPKPVLNSFSSFGM